MKKKWLLALAFLLLVFLLAACNGDTEEQEATEDDQFGIPGIDVGDVPDIIAEVNGEEITRDEFMNIYIGQYQQEMVQSQMTEEEVDQDQLKQEVAETLIGQELVFQEAERQGLEASEEEIDESLNELLARSGADSQEELLEALQEQGVTEEELISQIEIQIKVDALISSKIGDLEPTDEELEALYESYVAEMEETQGEDAEIPSFEEVESQLTQQAIAQKESEAYLALVEELEADADITNRL